MTRDSVRVLRRLLPWLTVAVAAAILYDGWIFYSRWRDARNAKQASQAAEAQRDRQSLELLGGTDFRIIDFYASPQSIRRGAQTRICYGVYGAKRIRIEPPVEDLHPTITNCFDAAPRATTIYKLIAEDAAGHTATANLTIEVVR